MLWQWSDNRAGGGALEIVMDMEQRVKLYVYGITQSQIKLGAYALILAQHGNSTQRVPIVVGIAEAQSIAAHLQGVNMPRPLSHDTMTTILKAFGISIKEVYIKNFESGVFYSDIVLSDGEQDILIDSRASDAIALAVRFKAPIYTNDEVMQKCSYTSEKADEQEPSEPEPIAEVALERYAVSELQKMLAKCVEREEYEMAARIKAIIEDKNNKANIKENE